jgi:N-acetylneuraminate synthase
MNFVKIGKKKIGSNHPTYFIADIGANHDGSLSRAKTLIRLAAESGANAAKFQHFKADTIVSDKGFKDLQSKFSHQAKWKKSVFEVYKDASISFKWTQELKKTCSKYKIDFLTSPYDINYVDMLNRFVPAFKIGSGDITWFEILEYIAKKKKPCILAIGASSIKDVIQAVKIIEKYNNKIILLQCNTNYTGNLENIKYLNINVIRRLKERYPNYIIGLSDHTKDDLSVIAAVTLGARVIEKHFTDDNTRDGPDHYFAINPLSWKKMIEKIRLLESSLGDGFKKIEINEYQTSILQRRSLRFSRDLKKNDKILYSDLVALRPCPKYAISPNYIKKIIGKKLKKNVKFHDCIKWRHIK